MKITTETWLDLTWKTVFRNSTHQFFKLNSLKKFGQCQRKKALVSKWLAEGHKGLTAHRCFRFFLVKCVNFCQWLCFVTDCQKQKGRQRSHNVHANIINFLKVSVTVLARTGIWQQTCRYGMRARMYDDASQNILLTLKLKQVISESF